jgi:hypothetical protein
MFAHPAHMITARWPILLEPRPRLAAAAGSLAAANAPKAGRRK